MEEELHCVEGGAGREPGREVAGAGGECDGGGP